MTDEVETVGAEEPIPCGPSGSSIERSRWTQDRWKVGCFDSCALRGASVATAPTFLSFCLTSRVPAETRQSSSTSAAAPPPASSSEAVGISWLCNGPDVNGEATEVECEPRDASAATASSCAVVHSSVSSPFVATDLPAVPESPDAGSQGVLCVAPMSVVVQALPPDTCPMMDVKTVFRRRGIDQTGYMGSLLPTIPTNKRSTDHYRTQGILTSLAVALCHAHIFL